MYIFGGKDEDNEKLKDLWCFEFATRMWKQLPSEDESIISRSGHSAQVYNEYMLIFGGIHEVTSELDDMIAFNLKKNEWVQLFSEYVAPKVPELTSP